MKAAWLLRVRAVYVAHLMNWHPRPSPRLPIVPRVCSPNSSLVASRSGVAEPWRAQRQSPDMILLHYTGMPDGQTALARLCDRLEQVSAHYFVFEDGHIVQCVPEVRRAWHAGRIPGPARPTSTPARSASRSSIPATTSAIRIFRAADRGGDRAVPRHLRAVPSARPRARPFRRRAARASRIRARNFPGRLLNESGVGHWVSLRPSTPAEASMPRGDSGDPVRVAGRDSRQYGYGIHAAAIMTRTPSRRDRLPAPFPPGTGWTASPTPRPLTRSRALLAATRDHAPRCEACLPDDA